jgi:predicted oxidoreductase
VAALTAHLPFALVSNQPEYSALHLDPLRDGTLDACMRDGTTPLAWSPLAGGRLATGDGVRPELLVELDRLAGREGVDRSQVALAFVLAHPSRPVAIIGTQRLERIGAALAALTVDLQRADVYAIIQASEGQELP